MQNVLMIDTSLPGCSVGLAYGGQVFSEFLETERGQAEHLVPLAQGVLTDAGIGFDALEAVVVTVGPGSFTGIRIGVSAAKSFGLALGVPVFGVSTLQAVALSYDAQDDFIVAGETKRQDYYVQAFGRDGAPKSGAQSLLADGLTELYGGRICIGDGAARLQADRQADFTWPDPVVRIDAARVLTAFADPQKRDALFTGDLSPVYLRAPDVSLPKTPPRKIEAL
ncbi:MAG: tRNA (adenosine(37)-N6)-threonylcarbamoyltransferase complex dimerization subunit type 1 TsaB [Bdellovibrionales bacterium]